MEPTVQELLQRPLVPDHERILRALHEPFWDAEAKRASPSAFTGNRVSVSRLAVLPYDDIVRIFRRDLERVDRKIEAVAEIQVGLLRSFSVTSEAVEEGTVLLVVKDPKDTNISHAEIMGVNKNGTELKKITRGLANKILQACELKPL